MKKYLLYVGVLIIGLSACKKNDTTPIPPADPSVQARIDSIAITTYLQTHPDIHATRHSSGLYYEVLTQGTGVNPTAESLVTLEYKGQTLKGAIFDQGTFTTLLNDRANVIQGFKIGVPLVKTGGKILLIIPSALAYGGFSPDPAIGANAILIFTITLKETK